jgi:hypothetical protein
MLRLIKLKQILGELDNLTPQDALFFELHENLHTNEYGHLCDKNEFIIVHYDFNTHEFLYSKYYFYSFFENKFKCDKLEFINLLAGILERHLNCGELTPVMFY